MGRTSGSSTRTAGFVLAVALLAALVSAPPAGAKAPGRPRPAPAGSATTYQHDERHDGHTSEELTLPLTPAWSHDFGEAVSYPLVVKGRVFVATSSIGSVGGSRLWALDAATGAVLWGPLALGGSYYINGIAADGSNVYSINYDGQLRAIDERTGAVVWSESLGDYNDTSPPTVYRGTVYVGGSGRLTAVDAATGVVEWRSPVVYGDDSSPVVTPDAVYVSYACEVVHRIDRRTGVHVWDHTTGCSGGGGRTAALNGSRLYVRDDAAMSPTILSTVTGASTGTFDSKTAPTFGGRRSFYLNSAGMLEGVDDHGNHLWSAAGDGQLVTAPIDVGPDVVVGSATGMVFVFDGATGAVAWSAQTGSEISAPDEHNVRPLVGLAESGMRLFVPATNTLVAYASG